MAMEFCGIRWARVLAQALKGSDDRVGQSHISLGFPYSWWFRQEKIVWMCNINCTTSGCQSTGLLEPPFISQLLDWIFITAFFNGLMERQLWSRDVATEHKVAGQPPAWQPIWVSLSSPSSLGPSWPFWGLLGLHDLRWAFQGLGSFASRRPDKVQKVSAPKHNSTVSLNRSLAQWSFEWVE